MRRLVLSLALLGLLATAPAALGASDPRRGEQWGLSMIHSDQAHATTAGAGAVVAVIDSGVRATHADLAGQLVAGHDFVQKDDTPQDGNGHGTHVTGIIAAATGNGVGVASVAPAAKVMPIRVLDDDGEGFSEDVIAGIDYAVAHGADVINLSLGGQVPLVDNIAGDPDFNAAIDRALDAGVIVVAAAGNNGLPACEQPSGQGRLLCVGAVDEQRNRSFYSNFGDGLGLMAPGGSALLGADILSTYNGSDNDYQALAGTSQATPHVAGVAALLVSLGVRGQTAVRRILATASDAGPAGPDSEYGAGIVDAQAAVAGLGAGGAGGSTSTGGSAFALYVPRSLHIAYVRRHGIRVRCTAAGSGRCRVSVRYGRRVLAAGSGALTAGRPRSVLARLTRTGRYVLRRARRSFRVSVRVALPGVRLQVRGLLLRR
jgi:subtilisin family serine protease